MHKNLKLIVKIFTFVSLIVLLSLTSYAWFADRSNPTINGSNIQVSAADGLVIKLSPDSISRTTVDLNQVISDYDAFELRQVSSSDGNNFYYIDFGEGLSMSSPKFVKINDTNNARSYGYVDYDFYLETEEYAKYVYLHRDSYLDGVASNSLRIAITVTNSNGEEITTIIGDTAENGITNPFITEAVSGEGEFEYGNIDSSLISHQIVKTFSDINGGRGSDDTTPIDTSKILTKIPALTCVKVNVKIWLEGGDVDCNNTIASTLINLLIKFGSSNVLLDPPELAVTDNTITNLTNDMELSYNELAWTNITTSSMTFDHNTTVYIRYKEVVGVTPASYSTKIEF